MPTCYRLPPALVVIGLTWAAMPALAQPSFDCSRARVPAERAICASPEASARDLEVAEAYKLALSRLADDPNAVARLKADQKSFVSFRDRLLTNENFQLVDYLAGRRDFLLAIDPTPRDGFEGRWQSFWGETRIRQIDKGSFRIAGWMAEPVVKSWICGDPAEEAAARPEKGALVTGAPDDGLRHVRRGRLLLLETISEPDVETPGSCGHLGPLTNALFPVMRAGEKPVQPSQAPATKHTARAYLTLFSGDNAGNDHRFFVNAADYTAPPLAERKALIASGESMGWRLAEETPTHLVLRHKTAKLEVELSVRKLDREFIRVTVRNPNESSPARRERVHFFELLEDGVTLDGAYPDRLALAGDRMTPPLSYADIPKGMKDHFQKVTICDHYQNETPFHPAEEKRLRGIIRPESCKQLPAREMRLRAEHQADTRLADLLDRAILAYRSR